MDINKVSPSREWAEGARAAYKPFKMTHDSPYKNVAGWVNRERDWIDGFTTARKYLWLMQINTEFCTEEK